MLDEPTVGLDPVAQRTFNELISEEHDRGTTVVMSSHVLGAVRSIATHVLAIREGRVVADGSIDAVLSRCGRTVTVQLSDRNIGALTNELVNVSVTDAQGELIVSGRFHGDLNRLVHIVASLEVSDLVVEPPKLDDLVDDLYGLENDR